MSGAEYYYNLIEREKDEKYKNFSEKIVSDTKYPLLGVRVPKLKEIAKKAVLSDIKIPSGFKYYEHCLFYGLAIVYLKTLNFEEKIELLNGYLPYADSWGITDSVAAAFKDVNKNRDKAEQAAINMLKSPLCYVRRFGIVILTLYFTGEYFKEEHIGELVKCKTGEYYVDMAIAWYISVLMAKHRDVAVKIIENNTFSAFIHDKAINKCVDSFRVSEKNKEYLKTLKTKYRK